MKRLYILLIAISMIFFSCKKDWLEKKRDIKLIVPQTLNDLRLLLSDDDNIMMDNVNLMELSGDDYYVPNTIFSTLEPIERNLYLWSNTVYPEDRLIEDWDLAYKQIALANIVLDQIAKIPPTSAQQSEWNDVKGSAQFLRAKSMYFLAQTFCKPYSNNASSDLGIVIRKTADMAEPVTRATLQETYDLIDNDLISASSLLTDLPTMITSPSKVSAFALLARVSLVRGDFQNALKYANSSLALKSDILNFNTLNFGSFFVMPAPQNNPEILQYSIASQRNHRAFILVYSRMQNDVYNQYDNNDLRKTAWFMNMGSGENGTNAYKGSYSANIDLFTGLSTTEVFLIRAEANARLNNPSAALTDVNRILEKRFKTGTFTPIVAPDAQVLSIVLAERQKELLRRGLRWSDIRRLSQTAEAPGFISRKIDGVEYKLLKGDTRYTLPIPNYIIRQNGIPQNPR
ncbi:RagB/SusD family nutrient uptake outer membrane protein [Pedobacter insulae]|uniref:SusD family protein n=1 Tax=Pedobacter insulae TaxID=414048 RepID=A0A1I2VFD9_9SPHI|nr:RagB/SusD family nutrient uptake outer membrane protein [Pedobacter insulae]SFG87890.1 SusD family protein [Pedobacter insulae]